MHSVKVLEVFDDVREVRATPGNTELGGDDIDELLFRQFIDLLDVAEHETVRVEGCGQPGPVELGNIHAELQLGAVHRNEACGKQGCHLIIVVGLAGAM